MLGLRISTISSVWFQGGRCSKTRRIAIANVATVSKSRVLRRAAPRFLSSSTRKPTTGSMAANGIEEAMALAPEDMKHIRPNSRLIPFMNPTVWHEFTPLANKHKAINLGQGFPDWECPKFCKDAAKEAVEENYNQYCRSAGLPSLVEAISKTYSPKLGTQINPMTDVVISVGVSEGLFAAFQAWLNPGDEVIVIEPAFDIYIPQIEMAGGVIKYVPLRPPKDSSERHGQGVSSQDWTLDINELREAVTDRTKIVLINNPHNPIGKVFTKSELQEIADLVLSRPNILCVSDEVYERIVYDDKFIHMAAIPGMWNRTISMFSAGKTFSVTGWKIGWSVGPKHLIFPVQMANAWIPFSVATPLQEAVARALVKAEEPYEGFASYYEWMRATYLRKRDILLKILQNAGLTPMVPSGSFFVFADTSKVNLPESYTSEPNTTRDYAFCRWLTVEKGVCAIPPSAFFSTKNKALGKDVARFAFCKEDETLKEAGKRLVDLPLVE